jgi:hypothetical protein
MFFILVVFLVFSSTILVFESFSGYSLLFKQANQQDAQNKATSVAVSALAFGGTLPTPPQTEALDAMPNSAIPARTLLPISNMNFTGGMSGWVFSRSYKIVRDNGYVTNAYLDVLPGDTVFLLSVTNADTVGVCAPAPTSCITVVSLLVDPGFTLNPLAEQPPSPGSWTTSVSGNIITWTTAAATGILPGATVTFSWAALVPPFKGTYFHTTTLTWLTTFHGAPLADEGSVTVTTNVVTGGPGGVSIPTLCPPGSAFINICAEPAGVVPGGIIGGYDGSSAVGSESGSGSLYLDFQPTYNGTTLVSGQQLSALMNFSSVFTIDSGQAAALATGASDALNFGYSLDQSTAPPEPLIVMNEYLIQLTNTGTAYDTIQLAASAANPSPVSVIPTQVNDFGPSGWITCSPTSTICPTPDFDAAYSALHQSAAHPWAWTAGEYELVISVTASLTGSTPPSSNYPSSLLMHFDDIGLALEDTNSAPATYFVDNAAAGQTCVNTIPPYVPPTVPCGVLQIPFTTLPSELQSIQLTTSLALNPGASQNVTAYVFVGDTSRSTALPVWVEVGQLEFSSSATITASIPAASASRYIDTSALPNACGVIGFCVRIYAISDGSTLGGSYNFLTLTATATVAAQTFVYNQVTLSLLNNSTFPVGFTNVYLSGPDGVSNYLLVPSANPITAPYYCTSSPPTAAPAQPSVCYVNQGQQLVLQLPFTWATDQSYTATVVTNKGLTFTSTFIAP